MGLTVSYKNSLGIVVMSGNTSQDIRITAIEGLGLCNKEYNVAVYSGYDGQETLNSRLLARTVTVAVEICCKNVSEKMKNVLLILNQPGYLFVDNGSVCRKIRCEQVTVAEGEKILKEKITKFVLQFVCDSPYFEDAEDTVVALYDRTKLLKSPFVLPSAFGGIVMGANICVSGHTNVEPVLTLCCSSGADEGSYIFVKNKSTGAVIRLEYCPRENDEITIDIKRRKIYSSVSGNIIGCLSEDTFLGDFVLEKGMNAISVELGNISADFTAGCRFSNLYYEAVML